MDYLLNFHVFNKHHPGEASSRSVDEEFDLCSKELVYRTQRAIGKHRDIIIRQTIQTGAREHSLLLQRLVVADTRTQLVEERTRALEKDSADIFPNFL